MHDMATDANGVYSNLPDFAGIYCIKPRVESRWEELNRFVPNPYTHSHQKVKGGLTNMVSAPTNGVCFTKTYYQYDSPQCKV